MADVLSVAPAQLEPNPENPRLVFHEKELQELQSSIADQGILVPLTVYRKQGTKSKFVILDGERRWRCAIALALPRVPIIIQPVPTRLQNIMMMFAIHKQRRPWDPLPTAYKLRDLEAEFTRTQGRAPKEDELAQLASMPRGEVRRLKILLGLPKDEQAMLMQELEKPRSEQRVTADHVLEATRGALALSRRGVINDREEMQLRRSIIGKFRRGLIRNTTDPRMLARIGRAIDRKEISPDSARELAVQLIKDPEYTIREAVGDSIERVDFEHSTEQLAERVANRLLMHLERNYQLGDKLRLALTELGKVIRRVLQK